MKEKEERVHRPVRSDRKHKPEGALFVEIIQHTPTNYCKWLELVLAVLNYCNDQGNSFS